jgi:hypothetical protein
MESTQNPPSEKSQAIGTTAVMSVKESGDTVQFSATTKSHIDELARESGVTVTKFVRMGLALAEIMAKTKKEGNRLAVVDADGQIVHEITGL